MTQAAILAASGSPGTTTGFKNKLINGNMVVDQRNAGASSTFDTSGYNTVDRITAYKATTASSTATLQQVVDAPSGFYNSLKVTVTSAASSSTASDLCQLQQMVEGYNIADLAWGTASAKTITISFWVKSSLTGQFGGSVLDSPATYGYPFSYTISSANTWEQKSVTIAGPTSGDWGVTNSIGLRLILDLGCGSNWLGTAGSWSVNSYRGATGDTKLITSNGATWNITGLQLEVGTTATNFDFRSIGTELALCQRYYQRVTNTTSTSYAYISNWGSASGTTSARLTYSLSGTMRVAPTSLDYSNVALDDNSNGYAVSSVAIWSATPDCVGIYAVSTGLTNFRPYVLCGVAQGSYVGISAEL